MSIESLAPLLPMLPTVAAYILGKAEDTVISEVTKKLFGEFTDKGKSFVTRLLRKAKEDTATTATAQLVNDDSESEAMKAALKEKLTKLIQNDPELLAEFQQLQPSATVTQIGDRNLSIGGNNSGIAITGDNNKIESPK